MRAAKPMRNVFIEGVQGTGKSTLLERLSQMLTGYHAYREGDLCPCELAWCSLMTEAEYISVVKRFPSLKTQIRLYTSSENGMYIVAYTRVKTDDRSFYKVMESYEVYNARISYERFCATNLDRYKRFSGEGNIFECALLQNSIETMMLFYEKSDNDIMAYYQGVYEAICNKSISIVYIEPEDLKANIECVIAERTTRDGERAWWNAVLNYFDSSPYAASHGVSGFSGFIEHLKRRISLEKQILNSIFGSAALIIPSKHYCIEDVIKHIS